MQSGKYHLLPNPDMLIRLPRQRIIIRHSREHISTLESSGGWLCCCCSQLLPLCYNTTNS
ncbi:unnamed protein product [Staurois parvus]|uniref:Uncharacterized protein n=1 Tax=Staurois parvus TaxID=386267 RepID=A0ABN9CHJ0_9NEOB|nr:unnamed protein product [Staurois parvus]